MPGAPLEDLTERVKDLAYVAVGLGVVAFHRLRARRTELSRTMEGRTDDALAALDIVGERIVERARMVEERVGAAREQLRSEQPGR